MDAKLVCIGEALVDFLPLPRDADALPVFRAQPGGAPANVAGTAAALGCPTALIAKVGDDAFGSLTASTLDALGVWTSCIVRDHDAFTTLAFVTLDDAGERSFDFARKPGADTLLRPDDIDWTLLDHAACVHFGSLSLTDDPARGTIRLVVERARAQGKLVSFDPNYRPALWRSPHEAGAACDWAFQRAGIVKLGLDDLPLLGARTPEEAARLLIDTKDVQLAFVTLGAGGCLVATPTTSFTVDGVPQPTVVDTTGAGDIFYGSVLAGLLGGIDAEKRSARFEMPSVATLEHIVQDACKLASASTAHHGGLPSLHAALSRP